MTHVNDWQHGLCGCFDNVSICLLTYFVPCYTFGKTAEAVGEDCCLCACAYLIPVANIFFMANLRQRVRDQNGIQGTYCNDLVTFCFCAPCATAQMSQEMDPGPLADQIISRA